MRISLIVLGIIVLATSLFFYYMPITTAGAATTDIVDGETTTRTSYASLIIPIQITFALMAIGAVFLILGLAIPSAASTSSVIQTREHFEKEANGRNIVRDRRERREQNS